MSIREWLLANCGEIPAGVDVGFLFVLIAKFLRARTGGEDWDADELASDESVEAVLGLENGTDGRVSWPIALAICEEIAGHWKSCHEPDNLEMVIDLLADTGWDIVNEAAGLEEHSDSHTTLTEAEALGYGVQHIINLSWAYRWWKYINGEDEEFNERHNMDAVHKLGAAAHESLEKMIAEQDKSAMSLLRRLIELTDTKHFERVADSRIWDGGSALDNGFADLLEDARNMIAGVGGPLRIEE